VASLTKLLLRNRIDPSRGISLKEAVDAYENEMIDRTYPAVLRSRKACLDANNYASVSADSPLIGRRAVKL
jgi:hypothetical protein